MGINDANVPVAPAVSTVTAPANPNAPVWGGRFGARQAAQQPPAPVPQAAQYQQPQGNGRGNGQGRRGPPLDENGNPLPPAEFWLNIGVAKRDAEGKPLKDEKFSFLSLPGAGTALDNLTGAILQGTSKEMNSFRTAQNHLLEQVIRKALTLKPGETMILEKLEIQLRRATGEVEATDTDDNRFIVDLGL